MKTMNYRFCGATLKANFHNVGQGWEVTCTWNKKLVFCGNFIHKAEALKWWGMMNREIRSFTNTYWIANKAATNWYCTFISNHLFKCYYSFLDKVFVKHNRVYSRSLSKNVKKYNTLRKGWNRGDRFQLVKAA